MNSPLPPFLQYGLAIFPVLLLLGLMVFLRWGAFKAGPVSWLAGILLALLSFGLTGDVFWVSQARGLLLSIYVLAVLWPALLLFNLVDQVGGIRALAEGLKSMIADRGLLLIVVAWAFSGLLEGLAGFGLPVAVVSPMLVALGVEPVLAVAAVAVGHSWSVTFGDMGVIFQTLLGVTKMDATQLAPPAALMLGTACLLCGLASARLLNDGRSTLRLVPRVLGLGLVMALVQYGLAVGGLSPLAAFGAGLAGIAGALVIGRSRAAAPVPGTAIVKHPPTPMPSALLGALISYGSLSLLMSIIAWPGPVRAALFPTVWQFTFPQVVTRLGFTTAAGAGQTFRPFVHPGTAIFLIALASCAAFRRFKLGRVDSLGTALRATWRSAWPASVGIIFTVGLSTLMDHSGMTQLLAQGLAALVGSAFPLVSPLIGILGAFATGSNNNSNVLFAPLQKSVAALLAMDPRLMLAAQTTGGALGSMIAPAKITVGCSTVGLKGREGDVLRHTLFYGLAIGLLLGGLALLLAQTASSP